jgi:hypothetical protein
VVDHEHALPKARWSLRCNPRPEVITRDGNGARKSISTAWIFLAASRKAKRAIGQVLSEPKILGQRVRKVLNAHAHLVLWSQESVRGLGSFRGLRSSGQHSQASQGPEKPPASSPCRRALCWPIRQVAFTAHYNYIVVLIRWPVNEVRKESG